MSTDSHLPYDAAQIFEYATCILAAAVPPVQLQGPEAPFEERVSQPHESGAEQFYEDSSLWIAAEAIRMPDGRQAHELCIHLRDEHGALYDTAFIADEIDASEPATVEEDSRLHVQRFTPGPWCEHLETLARRAAAVLEARQSAQE